jgi:predicted metalloprotease with PDZ domain
MAGGSLNGALLLTILLACTPQHDEAHHDDPHPPERHTPAAAADPADANAYVVRFPDAQAHLFEVEVTAPASGATTTWMMPVWTPGSYLVREYARHVEQLRAVDDEGSERDVRKISKNRWEVDTDGASHVRLSYLVYAREMTVRTNYVEADFAVLNGAPSFLVPVDRMEAPASVALELPEGWGKTVTGLDPHPSGAAHHYLAADYDELVDSPILAGNPEVHPFEVGGVSHALVNLGGDGRWDQDKSLESTKAIVEAQVAFWGDIPYARYVFLNVITEAGGGLEHLDSTLMLTRRNTTEDDERYERWLGLVSHEFFHTWNVKRMRPAGLGPFDYENEVYTPSLWIAEGITSYYDDLLLVRAGLIDGDEHLKRISKSVEGLQRRPGRAVQSLAASSFDAWIKYYRPDENSANTSVSYYRKGSLAAFVLDVEIRRATRGKASLDDVMRLVYERTVEDGYTEAQFREIASEVAGEDLAPWFAAYVDGTEELPLDAALAWFGLHFDRPEETEVEPWVGYDGGARVSEVLRDTPVWEAGLIVGDEILGVDGFRFTSMAEHLEGREPGDTAELLVSRRGRIRTLLVTVAADPAASWTVASDPLARTESVLRRERWWSP